jgi:hypothetical protein
VGWGVRLCEVANVEEELKHVCEKESGFWEGVDGIVDADGISGVKERVKRRIYGYHGE